jgi:hypothetical protein
MVRAPTCQKLEHSPTLNTILMVEHVLKTSDESVITIAELKKKLPKQVNHNMLKVILEYLEESGKIAVSLKGLCWVYNPSPKMQEALRKGYRYPEDFAKFK